MYKLGYIYIYMYLCVCVCKYFKICTCVCLCLFIPGWLPNEHLKNDNWFFLNTYRLPNLIYTGKLFEIQVKVLPLCEGIPRYSHAYPGLDDLGGRHHEGSQGLSGRNPWSHGPTEAYHKGIVQKVLVHCCTWHPWATRHWQKNQPPWTSSFRSPECVCERYIYKLVWVWNSICIEKFKWECLRIGVPQIYFFKLKNTGLGHPYRHPYFDTSPNLSCVNMPAIVCIQNTDCMPTGEGVISSMALAADA